MGTFNSLDEAREFFTADRFATTNGARIDSLSETECVCSMDILDSHRNAYGGVMGGVMFTLADFAFAALANNIHRPTTGQQSNIVFLSAPKGSRLIARAICRKSGKTVSIINVDISDDTGRDVAHFTGTGFKL